MPPYLPFSEALRDYVRAAPIDDLRAQLDEAGPEVSLLASDIRRRLPDLAVAFATPPDEHRYRLFESVSDFLLGIPRRAEARGLILILDDLHWAEPSSIQLFQHLARRLAGASLLLVGAYRTDDVSNVHPLTALLAEQRRNDSTQRLQLAPFTTDEVAALVYGLAGGAPAVPVVEAIARQTEGNPFFIGEMVRHLLAEGRDLTAAEAVTSVAGVPAGVREVIDRRLERLSATANDLLRMGAVLGDGFSFETLQAALGDESTGLLDVLDVALAAGMLREAGGAYQFCHALIRRALYDGLSLARRQHLHQQVARRLEQRYAGRLGDHAAELAEHFAQSGDPTDLTRAIRYAELAAERAQAVYAYAEAVRHLEEALKLQGVLDPQDRAKRCDLLLAFGEALLPAGEPLRSVETVAPEALAIGEALADPGRASRACLLALEGLMRYGQMAIWSTPAWQLWVERADHYAALGTVDRARADRFLALLRIQEGRTEAGRLLLRRALRLARELDDPQTLLRVAQSLLNWGTPEEQRRLAEEVVETSRHRLSVAQTGNALWSCGVTFLNCGQRERAEEPWREVAELDARPRAPLHGFWVREIWVATLAGELETAVALGPRLLAQAEESGAQVAVLSLVTSALCRALLYLGRGGEILAAPPEAGLGAGAKGPGRAEVAPLCLAHLGRRAEAQTFLSRFLTDVSTGPAGEDALTFALTTWLETAVLVEDRQAAAPLVRRLAPLASLAASTMAIVPTCIARHLGAAAALLGDPATARRYSEQALDLASRMRDRPEIALIRLQLAELLLVAGNGRPQAAASATIGPHPARLRTLRAGTSVGARFAANGSSDAQRTEALAHLDFAIAELEAMNMRPALARAYELQNGIRRAQRSSPAVVYPDGLSGRQVEVLSLLASGRSNREIADLLVLSERTVERHIADIYHKIGTAGRRGRFAAASYARRHNLRPDSLADIP
jgi:DNA-binding CsgD family transcriptional regulator